MGIKRKQSYWWDGTRPTVDLRYEEDVQLIIIREDENKMVGVSQDEN